jgi:hypothetical protein
MFATIGRFIWSNRSAETAMLACWIVGTFCFAIFVNWNVAARSILPMAPAAAIVAAQMWTRRLETESPSNATWRPWLAAAPGAALAVLVCAADASLARTQFDAAVRLTAALAEGRDRPDRTVHFSGHWGFQHYMQQGGAVPVDKFRSKPQAGDVMIFPNNNTGRIGLPPGAAHEAASLRLDAMPLVSTMCSGTGAGFYSDVWGPLPFAIAPVTPERYQVMVFDVSLTARPQAQ